MNVKTTRTIAKVITLSLITSTMIHATNGDNLIGIGAKARGMGGVGIAMSHGAESTLANPALITTVESTEVSFGGTIFMPDIQTQLNVAPGVPMPPQNKMSSDADMNMIPEVSIAMKINEEFYVGIGMFGTAGMGTDYSNGTGINNIMTTGQFSNFDMVTNLQLMQFAVPLAYKTGGLSLAIAPIVQYGNLDINYAMPNPAHGGAIDTVGAGVAQDFGFGYSLGVTYDLSEGGAPGLVLGAVYKSSIDMNYKNQLTTAAAPFQIPLPDGDHLEQPAEMGVGIAYTMMDQHTFAFDYRKIKWSDAKGYGDFAWDDSDVYAFGYQFTQDNWALRAGYNYGSSAVVEQKGAITPQGAGLNAALNMFNLLGFPATEERHYTVGGSYAFNDQFSLDLAYVYAAENTETFDVSPLQGAGIPLASVTTDHSENSLSFQLNYTF